MDGLTDDERILAWIASWTPSFDGKAIVNPDFTFRSVNAQFCKILKVTPAELINKKFTDITPPPLRSLDQRNAELVKKNVIQSYLLPKTYEFQDGRKVDVTLLVNGVYDQETKEFLFFVSTIMETKGLECLPAQNHQLTMSTSLVDKKKIGWSIISIVGMAILYAVEKLFLKVTG